MKKQILTLFATCAFSSMTILAGIPIFGTNSLIHLGNSSSDDSCYSKMPPPGFQHPDWQNMGEMTVIACGYDDMGIWRTFPLHIKYRYNGLQYDVTILSAWNPWNNVWDNNLNLPAVNTYFTQANQEYDFYVVLSTGTFYFNL